MNDPRQKLVDLLDAEFRNNSDFVRIHAAEALVEHGFGFQVSAALSSEADTAASPYRIGVWRVLARIAESPQQRDYFVGRLRRVLADSQAADRLHAAESLAKIGAADRADRPAIETWLLTADDATTAFPLWLLVLSADASERPAAELRLAKLLESPDPIARLRAAFSLGRLAALSADSLARLSQRAEAEPADSAARIYLLAAGYLHAPNGSSASLKLKRQLLSRLNTGRPNEQFEAATVIGLRGSLEDLPRLAPLLACREPDPRIAAANASLHLMP